MNHSIQVTLTAAATSVYVALQGTEMALTNDGETSWRGSEERDIESELDLLMKVRGLNGTAWTIAITVDGASGSLFKKSGTIEADNYSLLKETIPMKKPARKDSV